MDGTATLPVDPHTLLYRRSVYREPAHPSPYPDKTTLPHLGTAMIFPRRMAHTEPLYHILVPLYQAIVLLVYIPVFPNHLRDEIFSYI